MVPGVDYPKTLLAWGIFSYMTNQRSKKMIDKNVRPLSLYIAHDPVAFPPPPIRRSVLKEGMGTRQGLELCILKKISTSSMATVQQMLPSPDSQLHAAHLSMCDALV